MKRRYVVLIILIFVSTTYLQLTQDKTDGSTYSYKPRGTKAFFDLLNKLNLSVEPWLYPHENLPLDETEKTMILVNTKNISEIDKLLTWVGKGNRLVVFGSVYKLWDKFDFEYNAYDSDEEVQSVRCKNNFYHECKEVKFISGLKENFQTYSTENIKVVSGTRARAFVAHSNYKNGEIWFFSDAKIITNDFIDKNDNLRFIFQIITHNTNAILFDEFHHGFFAPTKLEKKQSYEAAIIFMIFFTFVVIVSTLSRAIRFGPPVQEAENKPATGTEFASVLGLLYREHKAEVLMNYVKSWKKRAAKKYALSTHASAKQIIQDLERKKLIA